VGPHHIARFYAQLPFRMSAGAAATSDVALLGGSLKRSVERLAAIRPKRAPNSLPANLAAAGATKPVVYTPRSITGWTFPGVCRRSYTDGGLNIFLSSNALNNVPSMRPSIDPRYVTPGTAARPPKVAQWSYNTKPATLSDPGRRNPHLQKSTTNPRLLPPRSRSRMWVWVRVWWRGSCWVQGIVVVPAQTHNLWRSRNLAAASP